MFSQQVYLTAQHVIDVLPVDFPQSTTQVMNILAQYKLMKTASMNFVCDTLRASQLYRDIKAKFDVEPDRMTDEEIICYALGTAKNLEDLVSTLNSIAEKPALLERLLDPVNFSQLYDYLPRVTHAYLTEYYFSTASFKAITAKIDENFMGLTPEEFYFVTLSVDHHINKYGAEVPIPFLGRFNQYLMDSKKVFEFICRAPRFFTYQLACELRFANRIAHMAADWMLTPKSAIEIVLAAMFARDIKKLDVKTIQAAIDQVKNEYKDRAEVAAYMQSLEATLTLAHLDTTDAERAAKIQLATKDKIYINFAGASLENLDLSDANLEYALVAPEKFNSAAKWKTLDNAAMRAANSLLPIWKELPEMHFVNMRGCNLRGTKLPYCMGATHVSLQDAKLNGSSIFDLPFLCQYFQLNHSLYEAEDNAQIADFIDTQLSKVQRHIGMMLTAPLPPQYAYVAKVDKDDPTKRMHTKSKHVAANLMAQYILDVDNEETAQVIYNAAFHHPLFAHTNKATALVNKALLFVTPQALSSLNISKYSGSQDYLFNAMDKRKFLLAEQPQEMRNVMN